MKMEFPRILWLHRDLIWRMTERQILGRYRGSFVGLGWSFLQPLAMLAVYTFVFSQVFQARWAHRAVLSQLKAEQAVAQLPVEELM